MKRNMIYVIIVILGSVSGVLSQCTDAFAGCPGWKSNCGNYLYAQVFCRKSCGTCSSGPSWTEWGPCDVTCGIGTQTRTRGSDTESRTCNEGPCPGGGVWLDWEEWGPCDKQCGGGSQTRTRTCSSPGQCIGDSTETTSCNQQPCPKCEDKDAFCTFYRIYCSSHEYVRQNCQKTCDTCPDPVPTTPQWNTWGSFSVCTQQCGVGTKTRTRTCNIPNQCSGSATETINCNTEPCPVPIWNNWSGYGPCSKTCGGGLSTRTRTCTISGQCSGNSEESISCNEQACPVPQWSQWSSYGPCDKTCGGGQSKRTRTCSIQGQCSGSSEDSLSCNEQACPVQCRNRNADWYCNAYKWFCGNSGFKDGCQKTCNACPTSSGVWNDWSQWTPCTKTCGSGESTRTRTCASGQCSGDSSETRQCNIEDCDVWGPWTTWSECTKPCGTGESTRTRSCTLGQCSGSSSETRQCNVQDCGNYSSNYQGPSPTWGNWGGWGQCDKTCGGGTQTRTRICTVTNACPGPSAASRPCNEQGCPTVGTWANWGQWGDCTAECGVGERTRTRQCPSNFGCGSGSSTQKEPCNTQPCQTPGVWQQWSTWGGCTVTCGGGVQERTRQCSTSGCSGPASEERTCEEQLCPVTWTTWTTWGDCSKQCGVGESTRTRQCSPINANCPGNQIEKKDCNTEPCLLNWNSWTTWGSCSKTCGVGQKIRTRTCPEENRCLGASVEQDTCSEGNCVGGTQWSTCSKSCGYGTQFKKDNDGFTIYQNCNVQDCPMEACVGGVRRRGVPWSCCKASSEVCGQSVVGGRIIGGENSDAKEWPFMASLSRKASVNSNYLHTCGAVIITHKWLLTAGHCIVSSQTRTPYSVQFMRVFAGFIKYSQKNGPDSSYADVDQAIPHPNLYFPEHDIGLLKLKTPLASNDAIRPVCLPGQEITPEDTKCFIIGWGTTSSTNLETSDNLQDAAVHNFNLDVCRASYRSSRNFASFVRSSSNILCAGTLTEGIDTCRGDSGGPLICQRCKTCNMYVAGIVSFGPWPCASTNLPGIYTKVLAYQQWIQTETGTVTAGPAVTGTCDSFVGP